MPKLTSPSSALHCVIVTLDHHLAGTVARVKQTLSREYPGLTLSLHAASDWSTNPAALAACKQEISKANVIVANMLFIEEHVQAIMPALEARRADCKALAVFMSAGEAIKLTSLGRFQMGGPQSGFMTLLKKLKGSKAESGSSGERQMKMLRRLPKILRFIPGTAQDVRAYFVTMQYWLAGSEENIANMVRYLASRYVPGLSDTSKLSAPRSYPDVGIYHPSLSDRMCEDLKKLPMSSKSKGTVGLLLLRSYVLSRDTGHYDGVIKAFEAKGLRVIPAFAAGLDSRPAIEAYFVKNGVTTVDAIVSLSGFSLVGGPAYNDAKAAEAILAKLDVPYVAAHPLEFQTLEEWGASDRGLQPVESTIMVAIPELEGSTGRSCSAVAQTVHQLLARVVSAPACSQSPKAAKYLCAVSARICWHHAFPSWSPCVVANAPLAKSASSFSTSHQMLATLALRLILRFSNRFTTRSQQCVMVDIRSMCRRRLMLCAIQ